MIGGMQGEGRDCSWSVGVFSYRLLSSKGQTKFDFLDFSLLVIIDLQVDKGLSSYNYHFFRRCLWILDQTDNSILEILSDAYGLYFDYQGPVVKSTIKLNRG